MASCGHTGQIRRDGVSLRRRAAVVVCVLFASTLSATPAARAKEVPSGSDSAVAIDGSQRATSAIDLGPDERQFTTVAIDAAGLCVALLTARGDLWTQRDDSTGASWACGFLAGKPLPAAGFGDIEPAPELDLLTDGGDEFVALAYTDSGKGRWQFTASGRVLAYGDAAFVGDLLSIGVEPEYPIVGAVVMPDDQGYWLFGADGGVFAFGSAEFLGSVPGALSAIGLSAADLAGPIIAMAHVDGGRGYYLFGADGGVFAFGSAPFRGSLPSIGDARQEGANEIVGAIGWRTQPGYALVSSSGAVASFGGPDYGDLAGYALSEPIVAVAASADDRGLVMIDGSGRVFPFGGSFMCDLTPAGGCAAGPEPGNWSSVEVAGVRLSDDRLSFELVPSLPQRSSCTKLRGFASLVDSTLTVDLQKRPTGLICLPTNPISPDSNTVTLRLEVPLPADASVVFRPTALGVANEGELSETDLIRRIRGNYWLRTTATQAEELLRNPEFVENWSGYLPYMDSEHMSVGFPVTPQIVTTYEPIVRSTLRTLGLDRLFVNIRQDFPFLTLRLIAPSDPEVDVAAIIADAWAQDTVCLESLYGECALTISTAVLGKTFVEVTEDAAHGGTCLRFRDLSHVGWVTHWASTVDSLSWILGSMSIQLDGVIIDGTNAGPIFAAAADDADALVVPTLWDGEPPWASSPSIIEAWNLLVTYSTENCTSPVPAL